MNQNEIWNQKTFGQIEYWNARSDQTQYNLANFNYDIQEYFTARQKDLIQL